MGSGAPTVVFESGLGDGASSWRKVQAQIARTTRACSYDRAGYGGSDVAAGARDLDAEQADLAALLKAARLSGPFVLVGHSLGGGIVRQYAYRHRRDVAGLVLVDTSVEHQNARFAAVAPGFLAMQAATYEDARRCADKLDRGPLTLGTPEAAGCLRPPPADMPPELVKQYWAYAQSPARLRTMVAEFDALSSGADDREADAARRPLGDLPLVVLTAANTAKQPMFAPAQQQAMSAVWMTLHDDMARLSTRGRNRLVPDSSHYIQNDQPQTVIETVLDVVDQVRARR
jgi:pimeloyl-ACP methyl ester carboxylesterase